MALNLMPSSLPLDFLPQDPAHPRSSSACSSASSASAHSRPHSVVQHTMPSQEDLYNNPYPHQRPLNSHTRHSSTSTTYSTDLTSPADSPPNHNLSNPALKGHLRPSHFRARAAASPYPRDADSVYSSSSETEDMAMFFNNSSAEYQTMYVPAPQHQPPPTQDAIHAAGQFGRMTLGPDHALEQLAGNVRAATTTSASDRAKQIFVQAWLNANYAPYPDGNVPRQGLYFSYRRVCDQYGIPHINTATLGKAIRLCFPTIKTRRLGVRGNSKYHYCGIRPVTATEIEWLQDYVRKTNNQSQQQQNGSRPNDPNHIKGEDHSEEDDEDDGSEGAQSTSVSKRNSLTLNNGVKSPALFSMDTDKTPTTNSMLSQAQAASRPNYHAQAAIRRHALNQEGGMAVNHQSSHSPPSAAPYLAATQPVSVRDLPNFPNIEEAVGSDSSSPHGITAREVWRWFEDHLDALLESVRSFRFDQFELHLRTFWTNLSGNHREVVHAPAVAGLMAKADAIVYDETLEILRSQMLSPIPPASLASLRQLADKMEKILLVALESYGNTFVEPKVELGARFGHLVLRFLDIFQVTQALSTVLTNEKQLAEMRASWTRIDFESVRNQSALVCNCRHEDLVQLLEVDFVGLLNNLVKTPEPVREVMAWADSCCERLMGGGGRGGAAPVGVPEERSTMSSRSVLIRWGYVTSQIMRDLTIRSDPAFGAFQILKLFLDDWIALNVLRSVALSTNSVAASVEPVIQQQFFTLSPMPGQEHFNNSLDNRSTHPVMSHTPTTSSMLAALHDSFSGSGLDPPAPFNTDSYASLSSYMDGNNGHDEGMSNVQAMFTDYGAGAPFDVAGFAPHDMSITAENNVTTPAEQSPPDQQQRQRQEEGGVKDEATA